MTQIDMDPYVGKCGNYPCRKTDTKPGQDKGTNFLVGQDELVKNVRINMEKTLIKKFPDLLLGNDFFEYALKQLESWDHFDAMVIGPDPIEDSGSEKSLKNLDLMPALAESADAACKIHSGFWGMFSIDCLACFVEIKDGNDVSELADIIRKALKNRTKATCSIGIATYPQLSYKKEDILQNAYKALQHAGFLGHNTTVRFDAVSLNISGDKLYQEGDVDSAIAEFENALLLDPKNVTVSNSLGVCYSSKGEYHKALEAFIKVMNLAPDDVMAIYNTGLAYLMTGDKQKAREMFLKAHAIDENQFEVVIQLGRLYLEIKDRKSARKYLEKAAEMNVESGPAHRFLGDCYNQLNMVNEAVRAYSKAVKLNANDAYSLSALALLYARQKINKEIAIVFARQSVDLSPSTALFHHRLGEVYYLLDRLEEALKEFKSSSELGHDCRSFILEIENRLLADVS